MYYSSSTAAAFSYTFVASKFRRKLWVLVSNELSRSRADEVSKQPQLLLMKLFVFFFSSLRFDILMNCIFVSMSAYCVHIVALCPKFPSPKLLFYFRVQPENLLRCDTLYCPNYLHRAHR